MIREEMLSLLRGRLERVKCRRLDCLVWCAERCYFRSNDLEDYIRGMGEVLIRYSPKLGSYCERGCGGIFIRIIRALPGSSYDFLTHLRITGNRSEVLKDGPPIIFRRLKRLYLAEIEPLAILPYFECPCIEALIISMSLPTEATFPEMVEVLQKYTILSSLTLDTIFLTHTQTHTPPTHPGIRSLTIGGRLLSHESEGSLTLDHISSAFPNLSELIFGFHTKLDFGPIKNNKITKLRIYAIPFDIELILSPLTRRRMREFVHSLEELREIHLGADRSVDPNESQFYWSNYLLGQECLGQQAMVEIVSLLNLSNGMCPKLLSITLHGIQPGASLAESIERAQRKRGVIVNRIGW